MKIEINGKSPHVYGPGDLVILREKPPQIELRIHIICIWSWADPRNWQHNPKISKEMQGIQNSQKNLDMPKMGWISG